MSETPKKSLEPYLYRDQVNTLAGWFNNWNECEQTVTMYSLLKRLNFTQTKFLIAVLQQNLTQNESQVSILEKQANDAGHLKSICVSDRSCVFQVLSLLPLLDAENNEAAEMFTSVIPACLKWCLDNDTNLEECRQLISYALIHPALSTEQRGSLSHWLVVLDQRESSTKGNGNYCSSGMNDQVSSQNTVLRKEYPNLHAPLSSTLSAPPSMSSGEKSRRAFTATPPTPLSTSPDYDSSYGGSTGSLTETGEHTVQSPVDDRAGMKEVPAWLKSLRLHKYADLFGQFTYDEMLALDDSRLAEIGVTKGARHKIVLSINKLNERPALLKQLEHDVIESGGNVKQILVELKQLMMTPIKSSVTQHMTHSTIEEIRPFSTSLSEDLPTLTCNVLGKLCSTILLHPDEESCSMFLQILDKCSYHEAFTPAQKHRVIQWKIQCQRLCRGPQERKWSMCSSRRGSNASVGTGCSLSSQGPVTGSGSLAPGTIAGGNHAMSNTANTGYMNTGAHSSFRSGPPGGVMSAVPPPSVSNSAYMTHQQPPRFSSYQQYQQYSNGVNGPSGSASTSQNAHTSVHRTQSSHYPACMTGDSGTVSNGPLGSTGINANSNTGFYHVSATVGSGRGGNISSSTTELGQHSSPHIGYPTGSVQRAASSTSAFDARVGRQITNASTGFGSAAANAESMHRLDELCRSVADHALSNDFGVSEFGMSQ